MGRSDFACLFPLPLFHPGRARRSHRARWRRGRGRVSSPFPRLLSWAQKGTPKRRGSPCPVAKRRVSPPPVRKWALGAKRAADPLFEGGGGAPDAASGSGVGGARSRSRGDGGRELPVPGLLPLPADRPLPSPGSDRGSPPPSRFCGSKSQGDSQAPVQVTAAPTAIQSLPPFLPGLGRDLHLICGRGERRDGRKTRRRPLGGGRCGREREKTRHRRQPLNKVGKPRALFFVGLLELLKGMGRV